ncbi:uncharacterized protein LOC111716765 [Eurytemora carolleeae]|uniref:uncharacterized protein LOC111716765 n=1 Tax=Eurytemora carolleeae TaxID=1294199 RepID=UPI000C75D476|nr:uncharacterized protein LOC111716765 [Eurytemora carolleeae]|eukprot:XP_023348025.1 uncharacterized protein LOC111716765 [Eurytemora affinis]
MNMTDTYVWLLLFIDVIAGFKTGKSFTKMIGSTTIFTTVSEPALDMYHCAFKCAAGTTCHIWEFKDGQCTMGQKFGFGGNQYNATGAWEAPLVFPEETPYGCACRCKNNSECTHFVWYSNGFNGNTCTLRKDLGAVVDLHVKYQIGGSLSC